MHRKQALYERLLLRKVGKAIGDFGLIGSGDSILVAHSGGKDSWVLLQSLARLQKKAPIPFDLAALTLDAGFPDFHPELIGAHISRHLPGIPFHVHAVPINTIVSRHKTQGTSFCSFCARLRRGVLYTLAKKLGCNKIALAHHADDFIETLLLNQFFNGSIKAMAPLLHADDGSNTVIRPLCYVPERSIENLAALAGFPILKTMCPAAERKDMKRAMVKKLLADLAAAYPGIKTSLLSALGNVDHRHLMTLQHAPESGKQPCPPNLMDAEINAARHQQQYRHTDDNTIVTEQAETVISKIGYKSADCDKSNNERNRVPDQQNTETI